MFFIFFRGALRSNFFFELKKIFCHVAELEYLSRKWSINGRYGRKWSIKPTLAKKLVDILAFVADKEEFTTETIVRQFGFTATAKRYLRQLTEYSYLESHGGNCNRTYQLKTSISE